MKNNLKVTADNRLFWFLKKDFTLDLTDPSILDMYVQQVFSHGMTEDIKNLLKNIDLKQLSEVFLRIKRFLPFEVKMFWEDFIGSYKSGTENNLK